MLLINLIFEFCVVIVQAGCTPRAWLPSDLATSPLLCNLYLQHVYMWNHFRAVLGNRSWNGSEPVYSLELFHDFLR